MGALQYVDQPDYAALILRKSYADLALPGAIMDRSFDWLGGTAARWDDTEKTWTFPSGATVTFGYLASKRDRYRYQSSEFQTISFDELTQFEERDYRYLFSRLRRKEGSDVPLRMRAASNPGDIGHEWVFDRFLVRGWSEGRAFIPAKLSDNPYLDQAEYIASLAELDPITRQQLLDGIWITDQTTACFLRAWWAGKNRYAIDDAGIKNRCVGRWISWDTGFKDKEDSAYTACVVGEMTPDYRLVIREVYRAKLIFPELVDAIRAKAEHYARDGRLKGVIIEDRASGISAYQTLTSQADSWLASLIIPFSPTTSKEQRAAQAGVWCHENCVLFPHPDERVPWLYDFEQELWRFPGSEYMDQTDAFSQLILYLENFLSSGYHARADHAERESRRIEIGMGV